jgi:hypothetical protein
MPAKTIVTNTPTKLATQVFAGVANDRGFAIIAWFDGDNSTVLPTLTSQYAAGCILINTKHTTAVSTTTAIYVNTGSATTPSWTALTIS